MSKRKDRVAGDETPDGERKKSGFALRLIPAVIFALAVIGFIVGLFVMYNSIHRDTFMQWYNDNENCYYDTYMRNDGTVELIADKQYDNWKQITISHNYPRNRIEASVSYTNDTSKENNDVYYFSSENAAAKTATFKNDNGETITFSYTSLYEYKEFVEDDGWMYGADFIVPIFGILALAFAIIAALQFIGAFAGRKHKWGNNLSIVFGAITSPAMVGILSIVGGVRGKKYLPPAPPKQPKDIEEAEATTIAAPDITTEQTAAAPVGSTAPSPAEYIKPKLSPKAQKAMMITIIASYALLLVFGILCAVQVFGSMFSGMGICQEIAVPAYSIVIGLMMLVGVPSIGYYFATIAPVKLSQKAKIILAVITTALMLALIATAYIVTYLVEVDGLTIDCYLEGSDTWFVPMSVAFAPLGIMICYLLTLFRINPEKIGTTKPQESGDGLAAVIKHVFAMLVYGIMKLVKGILSFKEKQPEIFILVATVLLTWLAFFTAFVVAIIGVAVLIGVVIMYFTGVMSWAYTPSAGNANGAPSPTDEYYKQDEYTYVDSHGYTQTIYTDQGGKEARDAGGRYAGEISGDGAEKKFTPAGVDNNGEDN